MEFDTKGSEFCDLLSSFSLKTAISRLKSDKDGKLQLLNKPI